VFRNKVLILVFFVFFIIKLSFSYVIAFSHYNRFFKKYITYFLFEDRQLIVSYQDYTIYEYNYPCLALFKELYDLKNVSVPSFYKPPLVAKKKTKVFGSIAYIYKDNQVMYLWDYSTENFYKFLDYTLRGLIVTLEDNTEDLLNKISKAEKIEYKTYLDYIRAFGNINNDNFELILCYNIDDDLVFEFLDKEKNLIRIVKIDKYYRFETTLKEYPTNTEFKF